MLTPFLISSDPPSGRRHWHSPDPFHMSSHRRTHNGHFDSNLYIRELEKNCALSRIHFVSILMCSRSARRLPLAPPTMAPPFQRDGFRLHSFLPPDWHGLPKFVDSLQLRVPGHVHCCADGPPETLGPSRCRLDLSVTEDTVVSPYLVYFFFSLALFLAS